jgi:hypothetical protein
MIHSRLLTHKSQFPLVTNLLIIKQGQATCQDTLCCTQHLSCYLVFPVFALYSLCKRTPTTALLSFLKQSFTSCKLLGFKNFESLIFDPFLSKTENFVVFLLALYRIRVLYKNVFQSNKLSFRNYHYAEKRTLIHEPGLKSIFSAKCFVLSGCVITLFRNCWLRVSVRITHPQIFESSLTTS